VAGEKIKQQSNSNVFKNVFLIGLVSIISVSLFLIFLWSDQMLI